MHQDEFEARLGEFVARFGGRAPAGAAEHDEGTGGEEAPAEEIAFVEFVGADALLQGVESHADFQLTPTLTAEAGLDLVRGALKDDDLPLPRIPPLKVRGGLRYQRNALQIGGQVIAAADQDRLSTNETPTDGYTLLKLYGSYSFAGAGVTHTITARLDNVTNELYRSHLSLIKDFVPEMGRSFKAVYSMRF
jgi:iron complex outermembrane receptor protein